MAYADRADLIRAGVTAPGYCEIALRKALHSFAGRIRDDQGRRAIRIDLPALGAVGSAVRKRIAARPTHATMAVAPADLATADQEIRRLRENPERAALQEAELAVLIGMAAARAQVSKTSSIGPTPSAGFAVNQQHFRRMPHAACRWR